MIIIIDYLIKFMHNGAPSDRTRSLDSMLELLQKRKDTLIFSLCLCHSLLLALGVSLSTCPFCDTSDSEIHFLLTITCPKYKMLRLRHTVRETYLPAKFYNCPSDSELRWLSCYSVSNSSAKLSFPLAIYISKAFELRAVSFYSISKAVLA